MGPVRSSSAPSRTLPVLLFLVLPSVSTTGFRAFLCDDEFGVPGVEFLKADLAISCNSAKYQRIRGIAIAGIFMYPVGIK